MTNGMQGTRIISDYFLELPKFVLLLAECHCPQSNFRTRQGLDETREQKRIRIDKNSQDKPENTRSQKILQENIKQGGGG